VNEASCVIQEAAHEDANIIFGAVVDQNLGGKIKITVIATGFDKAVRAVSDTPTDFKTYTDHFAAQAVARAAVAQASEALPVTQQAQMTSAPVSSAQTSSAQSSAAQMSAAQVTSTQMTAASAQMSGFAPSLTVSRRAPIELSLPLAAAGTGSGDHSMDLDSPLDVPAFLRRQN